MAEENPQAEVPDQEGSRRDRTLTSDDGQPSARMPTRIGHYHIKRVIASGGMGTVYEATQENPRRVVALKVMKHGIASRSALRRFEYESQILARLHHPGIAQVFEAGTHDDGTGPVPYFVMEYIPNAMPITDFAMDKKLNARARLELFARVCEAVHHGHQKSVIHRDLKPGNILVDSRGQVKIIDFGVARSTDSDLALTTLQTSVGQLIGTLQYMSPEQCQADPHDLDIRSDTYALGVVLYELLSGRLPYDLTGVPIAEASRLVREQNPTRPSTINRSLRGDVETILSKALEKERDRRYQSALEIAQDIRRYLGGEAILARPPSLLYQLRILTRRHRGLVGGTATVFTILLGCAIAMSVLYARAERLRQEAEKARAEMVVERDRAQEAEGAAEQRRQEAENARAEAQAARDAAKKETRKATTVAKFLHTMLTAIDPNVAGDLDKTLLHRILEQAEERVTTELAGEPEVEAAIRQAIGEAYIGIGEYASAEPHLTRAAALRRSELGDEQPDTLRSMTMLGVVYFHQGRYDEAEPLYVNALETCRRVLGAEHPDTLALQTYLAALYRQQGRYQEAEPLDLKTLQLRRRVLGEEHPETLQSMSNLAALYFRQGRFEDAEPLMVEALQARRRVQGAEHPDVLTSLNNLAMLYQSQGRYDQAEPLLIEALEISRRVGGKEHPHTLNLMNTLAALYTHQGRYDEAEPLLVETLEAFRRVLGEEHPKTLSAQNNLAGLYREQGRYQEAEPLAIKTLDLRRRVLGETHPSTLISMSGLAALLECQGRHREAERLAAEAVAQARNVLAPENWMIGAFLSTHGSALLGLQRFSEAEEALLEAHRILLDALGSTHERSTKVAEELVQLYDAWHAAEPSKGYDAKAAQWRAKLRQWQATTQPATTQPGA
jgi:tetratricopeptide (TPR) repeat protein